MGDRTITRLSYTDGEGERVDKFVASALPHLSRVRVQALIEQGQVQVNQRPARASTRLVSGDVVEVVETAQRAPVPRSSSEEGFPLEVVFEDEQVLVVNKPPGLVVHPAPGYAGMTLVDLLLARHPSLAQMSNPSEGRWPGIVHRLDKDTSGLLIVAKTSEALTLLSQQFQERQVVKRYLALLDGRLSLKEGAIEAPIGRDPRQRHRMAVVAQGGRQAQTLFWVEREFARFTLAKVQILTGRTHQIRVHFAAIGHPVAGDALYGHVQTPQPPRMFLHALEVQFTHPTTGELVVRTAPLPADLQAFLQALGPENAGAY
ncbi:MAG TPA: RluA family pseudouridine synthase [Ktedonobacterales bacterium]